MSNIKFIQRHGKWLLRAGWDYMLRLSYSNYVGRETISLHMDELYRTMKAEKLYWVANNYPNTSGTTVTVVVAGGQSLNIGGVELVWKGKGRWEIEHWADVIPEEGELVLDGDDTGMWEEAEENGGTTVIGFLQ